MDDLYLNGLQLAFLIGLIKVAVAASAVFSLRATNLAKVGVYYSPMRGTFASDRPVTVPKFIFFSIYMLLIAPLFSWLSVLSAGWGIIGWLTNRTAAPERLKEIQFKIAHVPQSKDQMIAMQNEIALTLKITPLNFGSETGTENDNFTLVLDPGEWYLEVSIDPQAKILMYYGHTPDFDKHFSKYEYRITGESVECRCIEDRFDHLREKEWQIKDSVVLETEIRKRHEGISPKLVELEETLESLQKAVSWHALTRYEVKFFVMSNHPELFPQHELRRLIRQDLERIKLGKKRVIKYASEAGLKINESSDGIEIRYPDNYPIEKRIEIEKVFEVTAMKSAFGISIPELDAFNKHEAHLLHLLGEEVSLKKARAG